MKTDYLNDDEGILLKSTINVDVNSKKYKFADVVLKTIHLGMQVMIFILLYQLRAKNYFVIILLVLFIFYYLGGIYDTKKKNTLRSIIRKQYRIIADK